MATHLTAPTLLDPADPAVQALLAKMQGNILKSHGRSEVALMLVRIGPEHRHLIEFLHWAGRIVTTAAQQREDSRSWRETGREAPPFWSVGLAYPIYSRLGRSPSGNLDPSFRFGMAGQWPERLPGFRADSVWGADAILQVAADTAGTVDSAVTAAGHAMTAFASVMRVERGSRIGYGGPGGPPAEHFGFLDGLSNPVFLKGSSHVVPHPQFDPATPDLVLFPDPFLQNGEGYASYLACLKLAQDVTAFQAAGQQLAASAGISTADAKAWIIGRRPNGTPLLPGTVAAGAPHLRNDFNYSLDPDGRWCPFASHVRKMNLRPSQGGLRIVRRGIPYGPAYQLGEPEGVERGLLFLSYQRWFNSVLGHMIDQWSGSPTFPLPHHPGVDPVLSARGASNWPAAGGTVSLDLPRFVQFAGGDLFLVPSPGFFGSV